MLYSGVTVSEFSDQRECDYESMKQKLMVEDLKRINVTCILIDRYSEIETVLEKLSGRHLELEREHRKPQSLFVSGAAHEFGDWPTDRARGF